MIEAGTIAKALEIRMKKRLYNYERIQPEPGLKLEINLDHLPVVDDADACLYQISTGRTGNFTKMTKFQSYKEKDRWTLRQRIWHRMVRFSKSIGRFTAFSRMGSMLQRFRRATPKSSNLKGTTER